MEELNCVPILHSLKAIYKKGIFGINVCPSITSLREALEDVKKG
jgi:hypothetical protein